MILSPIVENSGTINVSNTGNLATAGGGPWTLAGPRGRTGTINLGSEHDPGLPGGIASTQVVNFGTGAAELVLGALTGTVVSNPLENLSTGDRIELPGITITGVSVTSPGTVTINTSTGTNYVLSDVSFASGASQQFYYGTVDFATGESYIPGQSAVLLMDRRVEHQLRQCRELAGRRDSERPRSGRVHERRRHHYRLGTRSNLNSTGPAPGFCPTRRSPSRVRQARRIRHSPRRERQPDDQWRDAERRGSGDIDSSSVLR